MGEIAERIKVEVYQVAVGFASMKFSRGGGDHLLFPSFVSDSNEASTFRPFKFASSKPTVPILCQAPLTCLTCLPLSLSLSLALPCFFFFPLILGSLEIGNCLLISSPATPMNLESHQCHQRRPQQLADYSIFIILQRGYHSSL